MANGAFLLGWVCDRLPRITNKPVFAQMGMLYPTDI